MADTKVSALSTITPTDDDYLLTVDDPAGTPTTKAATVSAIRTAAVNAQTGTSYTLALTDANDSVTMDNASANTVTIPTNASVAFAVGVVVDVVQKGAGATTVTGDTGVTVNGTSAGSAAVSAQYERLRLLKIATDTWVAVGTNGGAVSALNDLSDATITSPAARQTLRYSGSAWINSGFGYGVFPVRDYGALPDSGSDESTNIQSAIDAAEAAGGGIVLFEEGDYNIATGLTVNVSNVTLKGIGAQYPGNSGLGTGSRLLWTGTTSASHIMIDFTSPSGASAKKQYGGGLEGITVDCDAKAGYGIRVRSWQGGRLDRFAVVDPTTVGVQLEAYGSGTSLADPKDAQEWIIENFYVRIEAPSSGKGMRLTAGDDGNVSFNTFRQGIIWHDDGEGILIYNGDNNGFERVRTFLQSGGTGWSLSHGGNLAASSVVCDHNVFRDCYFQAKMTFKGTGSGFDGKAAGIKLIDLDASNSSATPTSTGSTVESGGSPILWRTSTQTTFTSTA